MDKAKRAVGYIRVSDDSQAEQDKASLPEQERAIREYCQHKGYDLLEMFSDVGRRWNANRPQFQRMISRGKETPKPFDVIVVWRADRIVGSASTVAALEPLLEQRGIDIEGVTEPVHKEWLLLNALIAKGETEAKKERGKLGIKTAVERGHFPGTAPYGRRWDKETRQVILDASEAYWYREMSGWYIAGDGYSKVAKRLNGLGVPTRMQGKVNKNGRTLGKGWTTNYVRKLLTDPSAYGDAKIQVKGGNPLTFPLPPVVDRGTFELAQRIGKSRRHFGNRPTNRQYLISPRKGRCRECGQRLRLESRSYRAKGKNANGEVKTYIRKALSPKLICWGMFKYPHIHQCREDKYIDFDKVQTAVLRKVSEVLSSDDFALACVMPDSGEVELAAKRLKDSRDSLEQTTREINFVVTEGRMGKIPKSVFDTQMSQLSEVLEYRQERVRQLELEYRNADDKVKKVKQVMPMVSLLKEFWSSFKEVTVSSNAVSNGDGQMELPVDTKGIKSLRGMLDILVESFTIDKDNNVSIELSIPVLEGIEADGERCRQLTTPPSLNKGGGVYKRGASPLSKISLL